MENNKKNNKDLDNNKDLKSKNDQAEVKSDDLKSRSETAADYSANLDSSKNSKDNNGQSNDNSSEIINENIDFIIGKKIGMTQIFDEDGSSFPVTIVEAEPNIVTQIKTIANDGYDSVQLGYDTVADKNQTKAHLGKFKSNKLKIKSTLKEFRVNKSILKILSVGSMVTVDIFNTGDIVNVSGISKGKGFAGVMKRHGFGGGRRSHGKNSVMRKPGAIGASADPGRVWPGKAMAGRMGGDKVTVRNLSILRVDSDSNRLFINGSIPGSNNGVVYIKS